MLRRLLICLCVLVPFQSIGRCDDESLPPAMVDKVKRAAVYIQVQAPTWKGTGSGFVIAVKDDTALIATNYHVLAGANYDRRAQPSPRDVVKTSKAAKATAVFDSGLTTERSFKAEVVCADAEKDLAILRVTGLKNPPAPIEYATPPKLTETMAVYSFGFPFGDALATGKAAPGVTVGKASVSSIRLDDKGAIARVQIDGALNPGNSGGPIVDAKGKLVGVAVATIKDSTGIGLAIPALELGKMMQGRLGHVHTTMAKEGDGKIKVKIEVAVIDPLGVISGAKLHYLAVDAKATTPKDLELLEKQAGARNILLTVEGGVATGEFTLDSSSGQLLVQGVHMLALGKLATNPLRTVALSGANTVVSGEAGKPPVGWKEYTPRDNTFVVWLPEKTLRQSERERNSTVRGQRLKVTTLLVEVAPGVNYQVHRYFLSGNARNRPKRGEVEAAVRDSLVSELRGKIAEETDAKMSGIPGKEYLIEVGSGFARVRLFVSAFGTHVFLFGVQGNEEAVKGAAATTFLDSFRLPTATAQAGPGTPPGPGQAVGGPGLTKIQGGAFDPEFKEVAPEGGLLVGFEIGLSKFFNNDVVRAIRPVYRVGDKDSLGEQRGTDTTRVVKVIAKPGYAVGMVTVKAGLTVDGMSVTFMKIDGKRLDPKDSYESEWIGGKGGGGPVKLGGDGTPVVGIIGKANQKDCTGLGLNLDTPKLPADKK